jgi:hypothetical protein
MWAGGTTIEGLADHPMGPPAIPSFHDPCERLQSDSPPLDQSCVSSQGWKINSHVLDGPQVTKPTCQPRHIPTLHQARTPPHQSGRAHMLERGSADPLLRQPTTLVHQPTSSMPPCKQAQLWCISTIDSMMVWSSGYGVKHIDPWVHLYPSINRGSHPLSIMPPSSKWRVAYLHSILVV